MIAIQKIVVSLWRAFAEQMHQHCWKKRHWKSFWASETTKESKPHNQTASVRDHRHGLLLLEGHGAWRCQDATVMESSYLFNKKPKA